MRNHSRLFHMAAYLAALLLLAAAPTSTAAWPLPSWQQAPAPRWAFARRARFDNTGKPGKKPKSITENTLYSEEAEGVHHSIFLMHLRDIDVPAFWVVLAGMIFFTVLIDKGQQVAAWFVSENFTLKKFLEKVYSELMMFGMVAISLFVFTSVIGDMSDTMFGFFEFVDILCSFGALGLIWISAVLFLLCRISSVTWASLEAGVGKYSPEKIEHFARMRRAFIKRHSLRDDFLFHDYLDDSIGENCFNVIDLRWYTWILLALLPAAGWLLRSLAGKNMSDVAFLAQLGVLNWVLFFLHAVLMVWIQVNVHALDRQLILSDADRASPFPIPLLSKSMGVHAWFMQVLALTNTFMIAMYVMSVLYTTSYYNFHLRFFWLAALGTPCLLNSLVLLPVLVQRYTVVQAFFEPTHDLIAEIVEKEHKILEDEAFLRKSYEALGSPQIPELEGDGEMDQEEFCNFLDRLNLYVSADRRDRLFRAMDNDKGGTVSAEELFKILKPERASAASAAA
eukprot:TRINITY_DN62782_c0_g1_i1.p1 TRINITY_DN62782_c0_g1~~TRINITY_DN62782_c0_g1_i1.p1  ORF type:complete len:508 (-),score=108.44 TRINITY_DN62782_c0_g1_i1:6-1529(-)